jgi:hypothetical protein
MEAAADISGSKNQIQAIGSAVTYLERYTLFASYGLASKDQDDDGKASGRPVPEAKVPGPKDSPKPTDGTPKDWSPATSSGAKMGTTGEDAFPCPEKFLVKRKDAIYFLGGKREYRVEESDAKTIKANFKPRDTAIVNWGIRGSEVWAVAVSRTPAKEA